MAMEAIFQVNHAHTMSQAPNPAEKSRYRLRNVVFLKALVLEEGREHKLMTVLTPSQGAKDSWYDFKVSSLLEGSWSEHSYGMIRLEEDAQQGNPL